MAVTPGQTLSHYRLAEKIGEGEMGVVYCARDERLDRDVATRVLPEAVAQNLSLPDERRTRSTTQGAGSS